MPPPPPAIDDLPQALPVRVLMGRETVTGNPWVDHRWRALGVVTGESAEAAATLPADPAEDPREVLYGGFRVTLHRDECEYYYHNLLASQPQCYVLTRPDEHGVPRPFLVSLSFDEANAYLETDDVDVFPVAMPPELYRWIEAFVLAHYVPEPRRKRKRDDWREGVNP